MTTFTTDLEIGVSFNGINEDIIFIDVDYTIDDLDSNDRDYCHTASRIQIEQVRYGNEEIDFLLSPVHLSEMKKQILENIGAMKITGCWHESSFY